MKKFIVRGRAMVEVEVEIRLMASSVTAAENRAHRMFHEDPKPHVRPGTIRTSKRNEWTSLVEEVPS